MDLVDRITNTRFLGREFLTWLWFKSDEREGIIEVPDTEAVELWFDDKLVLAGADSREQNTLKSESPTESPEARAALRMGKKVIEAKVRLIQGNRQWAFNLKADTLALSGLKIPALLTRQEDDQMLERFFLVEEVNNLVLGLYRGFIELRLDKDKWATGLDKIHAWVKTDPQA